MTDVNINFVRYCKAFLEERCSLSTAEAQILILDPELGPPMDEVKRRWVWERLAPSADPDDFLIPLNYDAPEMQEINTLLSEFADEYAERVPRILGYLRTLGHPLGDASPNE